MIPSSTNLFPPIPDASPFEFLLRLFDLFGPVRTGGYAISTVIYLDLVLTVDQINAGAVLWINPSKFSIGKVRDIIIHPKTNFAGGNRNLVIGTDNGDAFTTISTGNLTSQVNSRWGSTVMPMEPGNTTVVNGQNITAYYDGGSADYTSGDLYITLEVEQIG